MSIHLDQVKFSALEKNAVHETHVEGQCMHARTYPSTPTPTAKYIYANTSLIFFSPTLILQLITTITSHSIEQLCHRVIVTMNGIERK